MGGHRVFLLPGEFEAGQLVKTRMITITSPLAAVIIRLSRICEDQAPHN